MGELLKQSTARTILVGPVLDADGDAYTTDDLADTDFKITKAGSVGALNGSATVAHSHQGHFTIALQTADTATVGGVRVTLNKADHVMPPWSGTVLPAVPYDALVGGTDNLVADLTKAAQQDVAQIVYRAPVMFVDPVGGADGNDGSCPDNAKEHIQAGHDAANAGDAMVVGPGTASEQIIQTKALSVYGAGVRRTIVSDATGTTWTAVDLSHIEGLTITATNAATGVALSASSTTDVSVEDSILNGKYDGAVFSGATRFRLARSYVSGTFDALNANSSVDGRVEDCVLFTDCSHATSVDHRALTAISGATGLVVKDTQCIAKRDDTTSDDTVAVDAEECLLVNCLLTAEQSNAGGTGDAIGVRASGAAAKVMLVGSKTRTTDAGGGNAYDLVQASGGTLAISGTEYSTSSGTITDLDQAADARALTAFGPPTLAQMNARTLVAAAYFDPTTDQVVTDSASRTASKANVSSLALEATLTAIKGSGWSTETLKAIDDAIATLTTAKNIATETTLIEAD